MKKYTPANKRAGITAETGGNNELSPYAVRTYVNVS